MSATTKRKLDQKRSGKPPLRRSRQSLTFTIRSNTFLASNTQAVRTVMTSSRCCNPGSIQCCHQSTSQAPPTTLTVGSSFLLITCLLHSFGKSVHRVGREGAPHSPRRSKATPPKRHYGKVWLHFLPHPQSRPFLLCSRICCTRLSEIIRASCFVGWIAFQPSHLLAPVV